MVTVWKLVATYALPVPIILLILLTVPAPRNVRKGVLLFVQNVFDLTIVGRFRLLHIALWALAMALFSAWRQLHAVRQAELAFATPNAEIAYLSKRWRAERNLWIAGFAFAMWCALAVFYREAKKRSRLEDRLAELESEAALLKEQANLLVEREEEEEGKQGGRRQPGAAAEPPADGGPGPAAALRAERPHRKPEAGGAGVEMAELKKDL